MVVRLVPAKSQRYRDAEATGAVIVLGLFGSAGRALEFAVLGHEPIVYGVQIITGLLGVILFMIGSNYWARWRGAEMVTFPELVRRGFRERVARPFLEYAARFALYLGLYGLVSFLLMFRITDWPKVVPITLGWILAGFIGGLYAARSARVNHGFEEARAAGRDVVILPLRERVYRHYLGYTVGLTLSFILASLLDHGLVPVGATLAAFIVGKVATDLLRPQPAFILPAELKRRWWHPFYMILRGALWWGAPLAALFVLTVNVAQPGATQFGEILAALYALMLGTLGGFMFWLMSLVITWGPRAPEIAADATI